MKDTGRTVQKSLRIPRQTAATIEALGTESGLDFTTTANQLLEEALRMRRCPGVVFTTGPSGRRATVAGTGIDVAEIMATYKSLNGDASRVCKAYHWLAEPQLRAALAYYALYPEEIDARLEREAAWTPTALHRRHPALAPPRQAGRKARR